jgi:hypothetical protein
MLDARFKTHHILGRRSRAGSEPRHSLRATGAERRTRVTREHPVERGQHESVTRRELRPSGMALVPVVRRICDAERILVRRTPRTFNWSHATRPLFALCEVQSCQSS